MIILWKIQEKRSEGTEGKEQQGRRETTGFYPRETGLERKQREAKVSE